MSNMEVALLLRARDQASPVLNRMKQEATRIVEQSTRAGTDAQRRLQTTYRETSQAFSRSITDQSRVAQRAAEAREQLGIRSENAIQREIAQTEAAYQRVARSGVASAAEQQRALTAMTAKVKALRAEMTGVVQQQEKLVQRGRGGAALNSVMTAGSAAIGAAYAAARPVGETMSYDRRLAMMSNTAYSDRNLAGRQAGVRELDAGIVRAVRAGGGTREEAADTLDSLLASGAISQKSAMNLLPTLQKFSTASGADPKALGDIAIRGMQTFGIKESELPKALDMAIAAGQAGGFELKDMAKWLPQQMAVAKTAGMSGLTDFGKILAANQAAVITAGSKDEAGNNLRNLIAKINSQDTAQDAKKLKIDLAGTLIKARSKGMSGLDAFIGIADNVVGRNKDFAALRTKAANAKGEEKVAALDGMANILQGSAIGKLIRDREALSALVALMGNRDYVKDIEGKLKKAQGTGEANFQVIAATDDFKVKQATNENTFGRQKALGGVNGVIGSVAEWWTNFMRENPTAGTAASGAVEGGKVAAGAGVGAMLWQYLRGAGAAATERAVPSLAARAATAAPGAGTLLAGAAPLGVMAGVTHWAQNQNDVMPWLKSLNEWTNSLFGKQAEFDARREAQLKELVSTPIQVIVKVENGNITAQLAQWQADQARRH